MGTVEVRFLAPDKARGLIQQAIERERRLIADAVLRTRERVSALSVRTGVSMDALREGQVPHPEDKDLDLLELEGEIDLLAALEEQLKIIDGITICP